MALVALNTTMFDRTKLLARPHRPLFYQSSPTSYPKRLPELEYPDHFRVERTYRNGVISLGGVQWCLSEMTPLR